jgi:glucokinase
LDAGGTNFVFSALQGFNEIVRPFQMPSYGTDLERSLDTIVEGFTTILHKLANRPVAISFAFPGPANYKEGVIDDLVNLPAFRGGVALGPMLENIFDLPVFINNDGNLFGLGEAMAGFLPHINMLLKQNGSIRCYKNLIGVTLGTGFGGSVVINGQMLVGDNSNAGEIWALRNKLNGKQSAEEGVSIRAIKNVYASLTNVALEECPEPKDIYQIALGKKAGNKTAARAAFERMATIAGDALANALCLVDGLVCVGGGLSAASDLFFPALLREMNGYYTYESGDRVPRLEAKCFNLEQETDLKLFLKDDTIMIPIPKSKKRIEHHPDKRVGVGTSKLGTSKAISIGAYAFALSKIDNTVGFAM